MVPSQSGARCVCGVCSAAKAPGRGRSCRQGDGGQSSLGELPGEPGSSCTVSGAAGCWPTLRSVSSFLEEAGCSLLLRRLSLMHVFVTGLRLPPLILSPIRSFISSYSALSLKKHSVYAYACTHVWVHVCMCVCVCVYVCVRACSSTFI